MFDPWSKRLAYTTMAGMSPGRYLCDEPAAEIVPNSQPIYDIPSTKNLFDT
jgi:hypothetical protein